MALLYRFTRLDDGSNTGIFTFIVTRTVTRDLHRDAVTKDFVHGYHRWALSFLRTEKMLGVFLVIRNPAQGSRCCVDFTLTLLNREHFSRNESLTEKQTSFTVDSPAHGAAKWIPLAELAERRFADETGEFLVELSMANVSTMFDADIKIPSHYLGSALGVTGFDESRRFSSASQQQHSVRIESSCLSFGGFEWNVAVLPFGSPEDSDLPRAPKVLLNRLTGFEHPCRVQYRLILGEAKNIAESGLLDQISDLSGRIRGFPLKGICNSIRDLVSPRSNQLHVHLQMVSANVISEAKVPIAQQSSSNNMSDPRGGFGTVNPVSTANCYDRDRQAWTVEADFERDYLRLKLFYADMSAVSRNHLRYVAWNTYVVRAPPGGGKESVLAANAPHSAYYVQDGMDLGVLIDVDVPTRVLREQLSPYVDSDNQLTIHIEWLENQLLFGANYHRYDDIARVHQQQMRREITALQSENYTLERQVFSYQKSISSYQGSNMAPLVSAPGRHANPPSSLNHGAHRAQQQLQQQEPLSSMPSPRTQQPVMNIGGQRCGSGGGLSGGVGGHLDSREPFDNGGDASTAAALSRRLVAAGHPLLGGGSPHAQRGGSGGSHALQLQPQQAAVVGGVHHKPATSSARASPVPFAASGSDSHYRT